MQYDRTIIGYHGCDARIARAVLDGEPLTVSENEYDWLGKGIYFWEYGVDRAYKWALEVKGRGGLKTPAVLGAVIQLGTCFDLLDTRFTGDLKDAYKPWRSLNKGQAKRLRNVGRKKDKELRRLDCAVLNWYLDRLGEDGQVYDTVRCAFREGQRVFRGSEIYAETHVQIAVRNPANIVGVFHPHGWRHSPSPT